jgi:hypothetical protein
VRQKNISCEFSLRVSMHRVLHASMPNGSYDLLCSRLDALIARTGPIHQRDRCSHPYQLPPPQIARGRFTGVRGNVARDTLHVPGEGTLGQLSK